MTAKQCVFSFYSTYHEPTYDDNETDGEVTCVENAQLSLL